MHLKLFTKAFDPLDIISILQILQVKEITCEHLFILHDQTASAPLGWMSATCVQQSLNLTSDSLLDLGLDFDWAIPSNVFLTHWSVASVVCLRSLSSWKGNLRPSRWKTFPSSISVFSSSISQFSCPY